VPKLLTLPSPYRFIIVPIEQYILQLSEKHPQRRIVVVIPELVEGRWYEYFLHNQRGRLLEMDAARPRQRAHFSRSAPRTTSPTTPVLATNCGGRRAVELRTPKTHFCF